MAEVEDRITRISNHQGVKMLLIVSEKQQLLRASQHPNEEKMNTPQLQNIASEVTTLAIKARHVVRDLDPTNDMTFFRVRAKKREIFVAPDNHLFLIVMQETDVEQ